MARAESSQFRVTTKTAVTVAAAALGAAALGAYILKRRAQFTSRVSEFRVAGRVNRLFVYPLKSAKGCEVGAASGRFALHIERLDGIYRLYDSRPDEPFSRRSRIRDHRRGPWKSTYFGAHISAPRPRRGQSQRKHAHSRVSAKVGGWRDANRVRRSAGGRGEAFGEAGDVRAHRRVSTRRRAAACSLHANTRSDGLDCGDAIADALADFLDAADRRQLRVFALLASALHVGERAPRVAVDRFV